MYSPEFKLIALHLSRELIVLILTSNCLRNITGEIEFYFSHSSSFRHARQVLVRKRWRARFTVRSSRVAFSSSRRAISCLLPRRFLARDCRANMPKKRRKYGCGWLFASARPPTLSPARRGNVEVRTLAHLMSCDLTVANLLFCGMQCRAHVARSTPVPRHGPHVCDMILRIGRRQILSAHL